ncbi:hypothetical protein H2200_001159 [Cladophialophora chaetospira]|uniref:BTB domain-containing protein n=1 Tax=Cladophialophora chaetospira TaxID=386627 RepID=A0AA39CPB8_9EURO|nr:hypothetical protein H2200_001159 [Cladophialophora chaetospira]
MDSASSTSMEILNICPTGDLILRIGKECSPAEMIKCVLVSSETMTRLSPVFNTMLNGHFCESQLPLSSDHPPTLNIHEDNVPAMVTLCQILHQHKYARKLVTLAEIVGVGALGDMYKCQGAAEFWFHYQLLHRRISLADLSAKQIANIIQAAYLFDAEEVFYDFTKAAVTHVSFDKDGKDFAQGLGDVLPDEIQEALRESQVYHLMWIQAACKNLIGKLVDDKTDHACSGLEKRLARYTLALQRMRIRDRWSWIELSGPPVKQVADNHQDFAARQLLYEQSTRCQTDPCRSCSVDWSQIIKTEAAGFLKRVHGFCLTCIKRQNVNFTEVAENKCEEHELPSTWLADLNLK